MTKQDKNLLLLLQRLEFCKHGDYCHVCPDCRENFGKYGHLKTCELALTIKQLGGKIKFQD